MHNHQIDPNEKINLSPEGKILLADWCCTLIDNNYDLYTPQDIAQAAGFLIANGHVDEDWELDMVRVMLCFAQGDGRWDGIKEAAANA